MKSIILFLLVTIAYGARRICEENCRTQVQDQSVTQTQHCKCLERFIEWLKANKPQEKHYEKQADSTIYYEPAKNVILRNQQDGFPFYFPINPILPYYYNNRVHTNIVPNTSPKVKRQFSDYDNVEVSYTPWYWDINIHDSNDKDVTQVIYQNKMKGLTEKDLKDCLDLHAIFYSRNKGNGIRIEDFISERNKIYNKLPDSDLLVEIKNKCNKVESIISESVNEIKSKRPHSKMSNIFSRNKHSFVPSKTTEEDSIQHKNKSQDPDHNFNKFIASHTHPKLEMSKLETPLMNSNPSIAWNNELDFENISKINNDSSTQSFSNESATVAPLTSFYEETTVLFDIKLNVENERPEYNHETTALDVEDTTAFSFTIPNNDLNTTLTTNDNSFSVNTDSMILNNITNNTTTASVEDAVTVINDSVEPSIKRLENVPETNNVTIFKQDNHDSMFYVNITSSTSLERFGPTSSSNTINRTKYIEGEYAIPKIDTTELLNDTIITEVHENIPNLDYVKVASDVFLSKQNYNDTSFVTDEWSKSNRNLTNSSKQNENLLSSENRKKYIKNISDDTSIDISGKLYLKNGPDYVPASFVQKPDGQLSVALDMHSLCKSNKIEKSKLIQAICNCVEFLNP